MTEIADLQQRRQALDPSQSFIVSAPAGSGKTGLITQRVLRLLCTVDNPEEILSITFTRKASREMASRIHSALRQAAYSPRPIDEYEAQTWDLAAAAVERNRQLGWNLLDMPGRLRIQTIDGFCRYIASQFALETKFGPIPEPSEQPQIHYQSAARMLLDKIEEAGPVAEQLAVLLAHTGNDMARCETLLSELLGKREQWLPLIYDAGKNSQYFQQVIEQVVADNLLQLDEALMPIAGELIELIDFAAQHVAPEDNFALSELGSFSELPEIGLDGVAQWKLILGLLVTKSNEPRKTINVKQGFPSDQKEVKARIMALLDWCREHPELNDIIANVMHLPDAEIDQSQQKMLDALGFLLPLLAAQLDVIFQQQGQCDYPAITLAALNALEPEAEGGVVSDITLRLDYQLRHILVDEFQDTSAAQIKLLEQLIGGWQPGDGRTLFLVGDAMQSLYGFRNANVGLFLNAQRNPVGPVQCTPLTLSSNFRSHKGIVQWVNSAFTDAFPARADISRGAIPYSSSVAVKATDNGQSVSFQGFIGDHHKVDEADYIAKLCSDLRDTNPDQSIAILVRGRGHLRSIIPALREANLFWQAIDITPLASRMPVIDLLSLTRALLSPADKIAWLAVLRAPFCGLSLGDLLAVANSIESDVENRNQPNNAILDSLIQLFDSLISEPCSGSIRQPISAHGKQTLKRIIPLLKTAWNNRGRTNLRTAVEQLWIDLGGPATLLNSADLSDARSYLDLLETWQSGATLRDWNSFKLAVDKLYAAPSPDNGGAGNSDASPRSVIQIMTIHKAKGLEFDHVILPGLSRGSGSDKKQLLRWQQHIDEHSGCSLIMAPLGAHDEEDDSVYSYLKREDSLKTHLESTRVLYVAATRAVRRLYLCGTVKQAKNGSWQPTGKSTLLAPIWNSIEEGLNAGLYNVQQSTTEASGEQLKEIPSLRHIRRLDAQFQPPPSPDSSANLGTPETAAESGVDADSSLSSRARSMGTVLHRTLKQLANEGLDQWPEVRINQLPVTWAAQLKELGMLATPDELQGILQAVNSMLADQRGRWILQRHEQAQCEQALGYRYSDRGHVGTSVIDRTFVDDGIRWIIDYKLSQPAEGESEAQFIRRQSSAYSAQLGHYAKLYGSMQPNPVRCALYFPQIPMFIELEAE
ncbi:ATP-dependent helicase/nuclease subunit A [Gammaproteobacteria bacterium MOLA455]|nr:ATP-dependent helicase/nuclease subunit A [Gammaproteobacteria bacterium MOLA455]